jgi:predicted nucleic acid-binding protein
VSIFADTSFLIALLDDGDEMHVDAVVRWRRVAEERLSVVTSNYVVLESCAVLQRHIGVVAVRGSCVRFLILWSCTG